MKRLLVMSSCCLLILNGCAGLSQWSGGPHAMATLHPTLGNSSFGNVSFTERAGTVHVSAKMQGLTPGAHGIHIHEHGDCSAADASSAGGHFNPASKNHGGPHDGTRHMGDMGNIIAKSNGTATLNIELPGATLNDNPKTGILGKSVIVHAAADDYKSQPAGNAGDRLACGRIVKYQ